MQGMQGMVFLMSLDRLLSARESVAMKACGYILLACLLVAGCQETAGPWLLIVCQRDSDRIDTVAELDRTILIVDSPAGIGRAVVTRTGKDWPTELVLHLKLKALEGITLSTDRLTISSFLSRHGHVASWEGVDDLPAGIRRQGELVEVIVPSELLGDNPRQFKIQWVDMYR
jgi:hypothetical protein